MLRFDEILKIMLKGLFPFILIFIISIPSYSSQVWDDCL